MGKGVVKRGNEGKGNRVGPCWRKRTRRYEAIGLNNGVLSAWWCWARKEGIRKGGQTTQTGHRDCEGKNKRPCVYGSRRKNAFEQEPLKKKRGSGTGPEEESRLRTAKGRVKLLRSGEREIPVQTKYGVLVESSSKGGGGKISKNQLRPRKRSHFKKKGGVQQVVDRSTTRGSRAGGGRVSGKTPTYREG